MEKVTEQTLERVTIDHKILTAKLISKSDMKLVSIERKHKCELNTITKLEREKIIAKDDLHALNLKEKDIEIGVSVFFDTIALISSLTHHFVVRLLLIRMKSKSLTILSCTKSSK